MINDTEVSSTCEMITELVEYYDVEIEPYYATVLLSGIVLDTNNFTLKTNPETLRRYTNEKGKIVPRRVTGNCALHQRYISKQVKRARAIALMPYCR